MAWSEAPLASSQRQKHSFSIHQKPVRCALASSILLLVSSLSSLAHASAPPTDRVQAGNGNWLGGDNRASGGSPEQDGAALFGAGEGEQAKTHTQAHTTESVGAAPSEEYGWGTDSTSPQGSGLEIVAGGEMSCRGERSCSAQGEVSGHGGITQSASSQGLQDGEQGECVPETHAVCAEDRVSDAVSNSGAQEEEEKEDEKEEEEEEEKKKEKEEEAVSVSQQILGLRSVLAEQGDLVLQMRALVEQQQSRLAQLEALLTHLPVSSPTPFPSPSASTPLPSPSPSASSPGAPQVYREESASRNARGGAEEEGLEHKGTAEGASARHETEWDTRESVGGEEMRPLLLWDDSFLLLRAAQVPGDITCLQTFPQEVEKGVSRYVAVGSSQGSVYIFQVKRKGDPRHSSTTSKGRPGVKHNAAHSAAHSSGEGDEKQERDLTPTASSAVGEMGDKKEGQVAMLELIPGSRSPVTALLAFLVRRNETWLVTGHQDGSVFLFHIQDSLALHSPSGPPHNPWSTGADRRRHEGSRRTRQDSSRDAARQEGSRYANRQQEGSRYARDEMPLQLILTLTLIAPPSSQSSSEDVPPASFGQPIKCLEVFRSGSSRYILAADAGGKISVLRSNGSLYGTALIPSPSPALLSTVKRKDQTAPSGQSKSIGGSDTMAAAGGVAEDQHGRDQALVFLRVPSSQRILFLTQHHAAALDLRTMSISLTLCSSAEPIVAPSSSEHPHEAWKGFPSPLVSFALDPSSRSRVYGVTGTGHILVLSLTGDTNRFQCQVRAQHSGLSSTLGTGAPPSSSFSGSSSAASTGFQSSLQLCALRGYLFVAAPDHLTVLNISLPAVPVSARGARAALIPRLVLSSTPESASAAIWQNLHDSDSRQPQNLHAQQPGGGPSGSPSSVALPVVASNSEAMLVVAFPGGVVGVFQSSLPISTPRSPSFTHSIWSSPVFILLVLTLGMWQLVGSRVWGIRQTPPPPPPFMASLHRRTSAMEETEEDMGLIEQSMGQQSHTRTMLDSRGNQSGGKLLGSSNSSSLQESKSLPSQKRARAQQTADAEASAYRSLSRLGLVSLQNTQPHASRGQGQESLLPGGGRRGSGVGDAELREAEVQEIIPEDAGVLEELQSLEPRGGSSRE